MAIIKLIDDSTKVHQSGRAPRPDEIKYVQSASDTIYAQLLAETIQLK